MSEKFEKQVKQMLDEVQLDPQPAVWQNVRSAIGPAKRKRPFIFWWLLPVALVAGGLFYYFNSNDQKKNIAKVNTSSPATITNDHSPNNIPVEQNKNEVTTIGNAIAGKEEVAENSSNSDNAVEIPRSKNGLNSKTGNNKRQETKTNSIIPGVQINKTKDSDPPTVATTQVKKTATDTSSTKVIAKTSVQQKESPQKIQKPDTTSIADFTGTKTESKRSKWSFGITADAGATTLTQGGFFSFGQKSLMDGSIASVGGPTSVPTNNVYQKTTASANGSFGVYFTANRQLGKRISFQSSLGIRHQSFSITQAIIKDTPINGYITSYPVTRSSSAYKLNYLDLYTGFSFAVFQMKDANLGIGAGIDNQFLFTGKKNSLDETLLYNLGSSQNNTTSTTSYNKWQPLLRLQLVADLNSKQKQWLQLSPYFNYGLGKFEKKSSSKRNHLASFGIAATYFFR